MAKSVASFIPALTALRFEAVPAVLDTMTIDRLLYVIENDIAPKTAVGVAALVTL